MRAATECLIAIHDNRPGGVSHYFIYLIILCAFVIYANTLKYGFIMDDGEMILSSPWVQSFDMASIFTHGYYASSQSMGEPDLYYRPLVSLSLALDYMLYGRFAGGFHLTNILLHIANCLLVYLIGIRFFKNRAWLYLWTLIFLAHPIHDQPVCLITGRCDTLPTCLILLGIYLWMHEKSYLWIAGSCVMASALFAKEIAVAFYFWLLCYFTIKQKLKDTKVVALLCILLCVSAIRIFFIPGWIGLEWPAFHQGMSVSHAILTIYSMGFQLWLLFVPTAICQGYPWLFPTSLAMESVFALECFLCGFCIFKKNANVILGLLGLFILVAPFIHIIEIPYLIPTHCLYLASAMPFFFFVELSKIEFRPWVFCVFMLTGTLVIALLGYQSYTMTKDWESSAALTARDVRIFPWNHIAQRQLGIYLYYAGDHAASQRHLAQALKLCPSDTRSRLYLGMNKIRQDKFEEAEYILQKCLSDNSTRIQALTELGGYCTKRGWHERAFIYYHEAYMAGDRDKAFLKIYRELAQRYLQ